MSRVYMNISSQRISVEVEQSSDHQAPFVYYNALARHYDLNDNPVWNRNQHAAAVRYAQQIAGLLGCQAEVVTKERHSALCSDVYANPFE